MARDSLTIWLSRDLQTRMGRCTGHSEQSGGFIAAEKRPRQIEREIRTVEGLERGLEYLRGSGQALAARRLRPAAKSKSRTRRLGPPLGVGLIVVMAAFTLYQLQS